MAKFQSPLLGYNNNVRHKNRVFHIQTEDSGVKHPHIITHLFMDGGRILKSVKTSYAEHVGADGMSDTVKQMMKAQHKAMFIALRDGQFDALVEGGAASAPAVPVAAPAAAPAPPPSAPVIAEAPPSRPSEPAQGHANTVPAPPPSSSLDVNMPPMRAPMATIPDDAPPSMVPQTTREELTLDFAALERAAATAQMPAAGTPASGVQRDLPPPPANLVRKLGGPAAQPEPGTGRYRTLKREEPESEPSMRAAVPPTPASPAASPKPPSQRPRKGATPRPPKPTRSERPPPTAQPASAEGQGRYAPSRPAAIFGQARPQQSSIFGEDLISDKSLDEVILSYLAEDLSSDGKK
ncbi:MAG TPA: hypothetical protein VF407_01475 [Polyangiaceae bacterium]